MRPSAYWGDVPTKEFLESLKSNEDDSLLKAYYDILQEPIYTPRSTFEIVEDLTYRKINDWDSKDLIKGTREKKEGWRRFSFLEVIKLRIISELRRFGLSTDKIKAFLDRMFFPTNNEFVEIERHICACLEGYKTYILIDDLENAFFEVEEDIIKKKFFPMEKTSSPLLVLPFFGYVEDIATKEIEFKKDRSFADIWIDAKEKKILELIRNQSYEEILIRRSGHKDIRITATSRKSGKTSDEELIRIVNEKAYQKVTLVMENGVRVAIVREETIKA